MFFSPDQGDDPDVYVLGTSVLGTKSKQEDSITGYTPIVTDRRGRERFHGAFTGGFNAGYYNTVGSETGYVPKYDKFKSSRNDKNKTIVNQTPLDFMDAEDMATTKNFLQLQNKYNNRFNNTSSNKFLDNYDKDTQLNFITKNDNGLSKLGKKLLKKCGWREGMKLNDKSLQYRIKLLENLKKSSGNYKLLKIQEKLNNQFKNEINETEKNDNEKNDMINSLHYINPVVKDNLYGVGYDPFDMTNDENITVDTGEFISKKKRSRNEYEYNSNNNNNNNNNNNSINRPNKRRRLLPKTSHSHGLSTLEDYDDYDNINRIEYNTDIDLVESERLKLHGDSGFSTFLKDTLRGSNVSYNELIKLKQKDLDLDNNNNLNNLSYARQLKEIEKRKLIKSKNRKLTKDGELPIDGFEISTYMDEDEIFNYDNLLNEFDNNNNINIYNVEKAKFKDNKMVINPEFIQKFKNFNLTVGSFLCRDNYDYNGIDFNNFTIKNDKYRKTVLSNKNEDIGTNINLGKDELDDNNNNDSDIDINDIDEINKAKKKLSQTLFSNFTEGETLDYSNNLKEGLTLAEDIPSLSNFIKKSNNILDNVILSFNNNKNKIDRFYKYLYNKLKLKQKYKSKQDNKIEILNDMEQQIEFNEFEDIFSNKLDSVKQYLFYDLERITANDNNNNLKHKNDSDDEIKIEISEWRPCAILCKRFNVPNPYEGMHQSIKSKFDIRSEKLFGNLIKKNAQKRLNITKPKKEYYVDENDNTVIVQRNYNNNEIESSNIKTKGEQIGELLNFETNEKDNPHMITLMENAPWSNYLLNKNLVFSDNDFNSDDEINEIDSDAENSQISTKNNNKDVKMKNNKIDNKRNDIQNKEGNSKENNVGTSLFNSIFGSDDDDSSSSEEDENEEQEETYNTMNDNNSNRDVQMINLNNNSNDNNDNNNNNTNDFDEYGLSTVSITNNKSNYSSDFKTNDNIQNINEQILPNQTRKRKKFKFISKAEREKMNNNNKNIINNNFITNTNNTNNNKQIKKDVIVIDEKDNVMNNNIGIIQDNNDEYVWEMPDDNSDSSVSNNNNNNTIDLISDSSSDSSDTKRKERRKKRKKKKSKKREKERKRKKKSKHKKKHKSNKKKKKSKKKKRKY